MILNSINRFPGFQQQQISIGLPSFNIIQAADDLQEQDNIENDKVNQLEWQQVVGMRLAGEQEFRSDLPVIDRSFPWLTSLQLHYTPHELACGSAWVVNHLTNGIDLGTDSTDLPFVCLELNRLQRMWFNIWLLRLCNLGNSY
jgi:hypothetical protein